jgi:hypothetical protein
MRKIGREATSINQDEAVAVAVAIMVTGHWAFHIESKQIAAGACD